MQPWHERLAALGRKKSLQIPLAIIAVISFPFVIRGWIYSVRQSNTWDIERKMNSALQELQKSPPGFERAEKYLIRLNAIENPYAPDDLKQALSDYISACERSLEAGKAGRDTTPFDQQMNAAKQRIFVIEKRYD